MGQACYRRFVGRTGDIDGGTAAQDEVYRRLGNEGRLRIVFELSDLVHAFAIAGIKRRRPGCSDEEAHRQLAFELYGVPARDAE
jgi:hypothetical protein